MDNPISVTADDAFPNVVYLERDAKPVLIQKTLDQYELRQGRCLLGVVAFYNGQIEWGWRFTPHQTDIKPSQILHPNPESTLKGLYEIDSVYTLNRLSHSA